MVEVDLEFRGPVEEIEDFDQGYVCCASSGSVRQRCELHFGNRSVRADLYIRSLCGSAMLRGKVCLQGY
jgi:hypothetical protein